MYQIDWDAKMATIPHRFMKLAIAAVISSSISSLMFLAIPHQASAQNAPSPNNSITEPLTNPINNSENDLVDLPEEVLRAEIYTDARSPIDGKLLSAAEYAELLENLRSLDRIPPEDLVSPEIRQVVDLLKLRKFLRQFIPFIP